jgi:hypothetical protein
LIQNGLAPHQRSNDTLTYLADDQDDQVYSLALGVQWSMMNSGDAWYAGEETDMYALKGHVYKVPNGNFTGSKMYENFPMFPTSENATIMVTLAEELEFLDTVDMSLPWDDQPTVAAVAAASSSVLGTFSNALPSVLAQAISVQLFLVSQLNMSIDEQVLLQEGLLGITELLWSFDPGSADMAVCSVWGDGTEKQECGSTDTYLVDGGYIDGPALAMSIGQYQRDNPNTYSDAILKVIIADTNKYDEPVGSFVARV